MKAEPARYARQIVLPEVGVNGQNLLHDSSALLIGVGGLGSVASLYLAGAGVGRLLLSDRDRVESSNLQRQIVYRQADVGHDKAQAAAAALAALNPHIAIEVLPGPLDQTALAAAIREVDIVLDCSDNFPTRFAVNRACVAERKPLVSAAAIRFEGQLALFDPARGGACYRCLYPDGGEAQETCEEAGVLGPVVGTIGSQQALIAIKRLLGLGDDSGILHLWDALKLQWRRLALVRDPALPGLRSRRMSGEQGTGLVIPRRFAIQLLHEAQVAGAQGFLAAVGAGTDPDCFFLADDAADVTTLLTSADGRFAGQSRRLWAVFLHRPGLPAAPAVDDFALRPGLLRLTASLVIKGVLQLRAWVLEDGHVVERTLRIQD